MAFAIEFVHRLFVRYKWRAADPTDKDLKEHPAIPGFDAGTLSITSGISIFNPGQRTDGARVPRGSTLPPTTKGEKQMDMIILQPVVALIAGILILIVPRLLNYIVAIYLIIVGILGLIR